MVDSRVERSAGISDAVVVKGVKGVLSTLYCVGDVVHQRVEVIGTFDQADWEDQLRVLVVAHLDRDIVLGEHIAAAESQLERVAEVDGH